MNAEWTAIIWAVLLALIFIGWNTAMSEKH